MWLLLLHLHLLFPMVCIPHSIHYLPVECNPLAQDIEHPEINRLAQLHRRARFQPSGAACRPGSQILWRLLLVRDKKNVMADNCLKDFD